MNTSKTKPATRHARSFTRALQALLRDCGYESRHVTLMTGRRAQKHSQCDAVVICEISGLDFETPASVLWDMFRFTLNVPEVEGSSAEPHAAYQMNFYNEA